MSRVVCVLGTDARLCAKKSFLMRQALTCPDWSVRRDGLICQQRAYVHAKPREPRRTYCRLSALLLLALLLLFM